MESDLNLNKHGTQQMKEFIGFFEIWIFEREELWEKREKQDGRRRPHPNPEDHQTADAYLRNQEEFEIFAPAAWRKIALKSKGNCQIKFWILI